MHIKYSEISCIAVNITANSDVFEEENHKYEHQGSLSLGADSAAHWHAVLGCVMYYF